MRKVSVLVYAMMGAAVAAGGARAENVVPDNMKMTSQAYVINKLQDAEDELSAKTSDKVVVYRTSPTGQLGERGIVTSLTGVTTSEPGIATKSAVNVASKEDTFVNLPALNVMAATPSQANKVGSHHIYSNAQGVANQFGDGLVRAETVNSAVTTALGQKFTQVDTTGATATGTGTLWRINTVTAPLAVTATLDSTANGTNHCWRSLRGDFNSGFGDYAQYTCSADTLAWLGEATSQTVGPKNGRWGAVFPYGDVRGHAVCSGETPPDMAQYDTAAAGYPLYNYGWVATSAQETTLDSQYTVQNGTGVPNTGDNGGQYCWCKMDYPVASPWVFGNSFSSRPNCAYYCAYYCANFVRYYAAFRGAVFGAVN